MNKLTRPPQDYRKVPPDDPAFVVALMIGVRGGRLILDVDS